MFSQCRKDSKVFLYKIVNAEVASELVILAGFDPLGTKENDMLPSAWGFIFSIQ